jgi:hypothetical protein
MAPSLRYETDLTDAEWALLEPLMPEPKICAHAPEKAREIVTGALNTVEAGQFVVIESTAVGQEGEAGAELTPSSRW